MQIVKITDPFNPYTSKETETFEYKGESILEIHNKFLPSNVDFILSVTGTTVPKEQWGTTFLAPGDMLVAKVNPGSDDVARMVAMLALMVMAFYVVGPYAGMYAAESMATIGDAIVAFDVAYYGAIMATMVMGGMLINSMFSNSFDAGGGETSQTYNWNPQTIQKQGATIPTIYGVNRVYGNIIASSTESVNNKNYINVLIALGYGPLKSIGFNPETGAEDKRINDQDISNFENVQVYTRTGLLDQTTITNFNDTKVEHTVSSLVTHDNSYTYTTLADDFDALELDITWPTGAFVQNSDGGIGGIDAWFRIEYKKHSESDWIIATKTVQTEPNVNSTARWSYGKYEASWDTNAGFETGFVSNRWVESEVGTSDYTDHTSGEQKIVGYDGSGNPLIDPTGQYWMWFPVGGIYYGTIDVTYDYLKLHLSSTAAYKQTFRVAEYLEHAYYDIRVTKISPDINSITVQEKMYVTSIKETYYDDFTYPRMALVGIRALATDQLSGSLRFSCLVEGKYIRVYDGADWTIVYNNNPAWVCYDVLTQPVFSDDLTTVLRYDGIAPASIDHDAFKVWADFCDELVNDGNGSTEKRFEFNGVFDVQRTLWDSAMQIAAMARGLLFFQGFKITVAVDKATTATQLFTDGNIIQDSFKETFLSLEERAGEVEIGFINKDSGYEKDTLSIFSTVLNRPSNKVSLDFIGVTKPSQAWRIATFQLACNEVLKRVVEWKADIDAISCTIGDVVNFAHSVPEWGTASGRIVSATNTPIGKVTLDRSVILEAGKTYQIMVRLDNDTLITKTVSNVAGTYSTLSLTTVWASIPTAYCPYSVGEVGYVTKPIRVLDIQRDSDLVATIKGTEYNASLYAVDSGTPVIPTPNYTRVDEISVVTGLALSETSSFDESGNVKRSIVVTFTNPANIRFKKADVYFRTSGSIDWSYAGYTSTGYLEIKNVLSSTAYEIMVISESYIGVRTNQYSSPTQQIVTGSDIDFTSVSTYRLSGLQIFNQGNDNEFIGSDCKVIWNPATTVYLDSIAAGNEIGGAGGHLPPTWFRDYEVKVYNLDGTVRRTEYTFLPEYVYTYEKNFEDTGSAVGDFTIKVKARDRFGNLSNIAAQLTVTNSIPDDVTGLLARSSLGGVEFVWNKAEEEDFASYCYRTKVGSGAWSDWEDIETNYAIRNLTAAEAANGTISVIYIEVKVKDLFGNLSANAVTANEYSTVIVDSIIQLFAVKSGGTGDVSDLYDGNSTSGGVTVT